MNPERWAKIQALLEQALEQPEEARAAFVEELAGEDTDLAREVLELIELQEAGQGSPFAVRPSDFDEESDKEGEAFAAPGFGSRIGDFELVSELGRGGMGVVYLARQISLPRTVALKVLPITALTSEETLARFRQEGKTGAGLQHPSIVAVHSVGETEDSLHIAMEYHSGGDLGSELSHQRSTGRAKALRKCMGESGHAAACAKLIAEVATGLHYAHEKGVVHRDIKPQNLLIAADGSLQLSDFGLARVRSEQGLTRVGTMMGTVPYMSPEQATRARQKIDRRTDIYSLGVVLYEMLTLHPIFSGDSDEEVIEKIPVELPTAIRRLNRKVPRDLAVICHHAMEKRPADRYQRAQEFADDLERFLAHESILAHPPTPASVLRRHLRRRWRRYALALAPPIASLASLWWYEGVQSRRLLESSLLASEAIVERMEDGPVGFADAWACRSGLARLLESDGALSHATEERLDACLDHYRKGVAAMRQRGVEEIALGMAQPFGLDPVHSERIRKGYLAFWQASLLELRPDGGPQTDLDPEGLLQPRLSVEVVDAAGRPIEATVAIQELDLTGLAPKAPELVGASPLEGLPIRRGYFRIVISPSGATTREFTRLVDRTVREIPIRCEVRARQDPREGMVLVEGGTLQLPGIQPGVRVRHLGTAVEVAAFYIDRRPVSVGQYRAYHEAVRPERPAFWRLTEGEPDDPWPELMSGRHDARTMTGLSWSEAVAYAEWRGVRLVSEIEWDFVARGPEARFFPDGSTNSDEYFLDWPAIVEVDVRQNQADQALTNGMSAVDQAKDYLANVLPRVDGWMPAAGEPVQLLLGNVYEWTESVAIDGSGPMPRALSGERVLVGSWWRNRSRPDLSLKSRGNWGVLPDYANSELGFRCASTAAP